MDQIKPGRKPHAVLDAPSRRLKAQKIEAILKQRKGFDGASLLDIGTGSGLVAQHFVDVVGEDGTVIAVDTTDQTKTSAVEFHHVTTTDLPFEGDRFDFVLSNHVIEHVGTADNQGAHLKEINRVLKADGLLYLAVPNRWCLIEPHFRLAFLSWLPRPLRTPCLQLFQGKQKVYDCELLSRTKARALLRTRGFEVTEVTLEALDRMAALEFGRAARRTVPFIARALWPLARIFVPTLIFVCRPAKPEPKP